MDDIVIEPTLVEQPEAQPITEPLELAEKAEEEPELEIEAEPQIVKTKKRHVRLVCPMCGLLSVERRFRVEHPFPNVMECHYKGRGNLEWTFVDENDNITDELNEAAQEQISLLAIAHLDDAHAEAVIEKLLEREFITG
jgi:hypothetical protein|tara:strand:+ start:2554 stop:2970 length:417 start_codon:yes stop_codon:yes gene_type:complete